MPHGVIKLINGSGILVQRTYHTIEQRKKTIEVWQKTYGHRYNECALQICPDIRERKEVEHYKKKIGKYFGKTYKIKK